MRDNTAEDDMIGLTDVFLQLIPIGKPKAYHEYTEEERKKMIKGHIHRFEEEDEGLVEWPDDQMRDNNEI
jgi:hypothetical protein